MMDMIIIGLFNSHLADCGRDHFVATQAMADGPF